MEENFVNRKEYNKLTISIFSKIGEIKESSIRTEESSKRMESMVNKLHEIMFGNGRTGTLTRLSNAIQELKAHRWFFVLIGTGLAGTAFHLIRTALIKTALTK